jgi:hypothetical protein
MVVLVFLVRLDYGSLCSFLVSFSFLCSWQENTLEKFRRRRARRSCRWRRDLAVPQFVSIFEARYALIHRPLVDMRPPALLVVVLWLSRCPLLPESSSVIGAWSSHARVYYTLWAARDGHVLHLLSCLVVPGGFLC